jgi:fructose-bisphosphate aldolase / 6-deoxy-5-ketofructose 1-phosphate synthase
MPTIKADDVLIPCDVPSSHHAIYVKHYLQATRNTGRLMLFAGDQKIEHLNDDFFGVTDLGEIAADDHDPEHLFKIAQQATIGAFAAQLGLINCYGRDYPDIPYIAKLNSKSHLVSTEQHDPLSRALWQVADVARVKEMSGVNIIGVGYTCYLGSEYENDMLAEAAKIIGDAHALGLLSVIWIYPRGAAIHNEKDPHLIAGACGVAVCLGADFVKVNFPSGVDHPEKAFREAVLAAGRTGVICAGGKSTDAQDFLQQIHAQIHTAGAAGNATGRNIHQKDLAHAVRFCNAISAITLDDADVATAYRIYLGHQEFSLHSENA